MKLQYMPVIHARTYNIDFRTGKLLVEPNVLSSQDSALLHKLALESTTQRELAPQCGRYIIYSNNKYAVFGRTVRFSDLYKSCNREARFNIVDHEDGRLAYGFVGLMIPHGLMNSPFELSDDLILDVYENAIKDRWEETYSSDSWNETKRVGFTEIDVKTLDGNSALIADYIKVARSGQVFLDDDENSRNELVCNAMSAAFQKYLFSLCTSLSDDSIENAKYFKFDITTCVNAASHTKKLAKAVAKIQLHKESHVKTVRTERSLDDLIRNGDAPDNGQKRGICSSDNSVKIKTYVKGRFTKSNNQIGFTGRKKEKSLDDLLDETSSPDDEVTFQETYTQKKEVDFSDIGLVLGVVLGITFVAVEVAKHASPVVLAITTTCTVVLTGAEAKRIIEKFR